MMQLYLYEEKMQSIIESYHLTEDQLYFTGKPKEAIALAQQDKERHPILAIEDGMVVCFFVLHEKDGAKEYSNNPNAILMRTFSTVHTQLRKGYAKKVLEKLPSFIHENFPHINEIVLAVNAGNAIAQQLYEKSGYQDTWLRLPGRNGELTVMSYKL